jgi:hypothetical protein
VKRILVIDSIPFTPHTETSLEVMYREAENGNQVVFFPAYMSGLGFEWVPRSGLRRWLQRARVRHSYPEIRAVAARAGGVLDGDEMSIPFQVDYPLVRTMDELKKLELHGYDFGMAVASSLVTHLRWPNPDFSRKDVAAEFSRVWRLASQANALAERAMRIVQPDEVVIFNGRLCSTRPFLRVAERAGVRCRIHERGSNFRRFNLYDFLPHDFELLSRHIRDRAAKAPPDEVRREGERFFQQRRLGAEQAWKSFTGGQRRGRIVEQLPERFVAYFSSSDDEFEAISEKVSRGPFGSQRQTVELLMKCCARLRLPLVIRLHPNLATINPEELRYWLDLGRAGAAVVIEPGSATDTYALLEKSVVVLTYGSTVGIEATYWGRPAILLGPSLYRGWGACHEPVSQDQLEELLSSTPAPLDASTALPFGWHYQTFGEAYRYYSPEDLFNGTFLGRRLFQGGPMTRTLRWLRDVSPLEPSWV